MIKVIKVDRKRAIIALLVLLGAAFCAIGFGGFTKRVLGFKDKETAPASVTINDINPAAEEDLAGQVGEGKINISNSATIDSGGSSNGSAYFVETRMNRERARGIEMETMREVLASETADEEVRKAAHERLLDLSGKVSQEMELENLIRARGFQDVAVFLDSNTVTVIVQPGKDMAADAESTTLAELVARATGVPEDGIIVITRE